MSVCEFDSGFSNAFAICVPVVEPPSTGGGGGGSGTGPIRRRRNVKLAGEGFIYFIGVGSLSVERTIGGASTVAATASATLSVTRSVYGAAEYHLEGTSRLSVARTVQASVSAQMTATGALAVLVSQAGHGDVMARASADMRCLMTFGGSVTQTVSAAASLDVDDEETVLALLGLPSEVVLTTSPRR